MDGGPSSAGLLSLKFELKEGQWFVLEILFFFKGPVCNLGSIYDFTLVKT